MKKVLSEKKKRDRFLEITAIVVALLSLAIGFLAYSHQIKIEEELTVHHDSLGFKVKFSSNIYGSAQSPIIPEITPANSSVTAENAIINNINHPIINNLRANFTSPGQKVTYRFYVYNAGEYMAYLNDIVFKNIWGLNTNKICLTENGKMDESIRNACDDIKISVKIGNLKTDKSLYDLKTTGLRPHVAREIEVTIEYELGNKEPSQKFEVIFGDISLYYSMFTGRNEVNL